MDEPIDEPEGEPEGKPPAEGPADRPLPPGFHKVPPELIAAWEREMEARKNKGNGQAPPEDAAPDAPLPAEGPEPVIPFCEEALTQEFSERHADDLRYCDQLGQWFEWNGQRWQVDLKRGVFTLARTVCREQSNRAGQIIENKKIAAAVAGAVASARAVAAVVNLARCDPRHATTQDQWDADPWILNTPEGIVDLRTGVLGPHERAVLCSKMTAVAPRGASHARGA